MIMHKYEPVARNQQYIKLINRAVVYRAIRESGMISRAELSIGTGLNPATLTHITRELLSQGFIEEAGYGDSQGGRRRSLLRIRSDHGYIIAVRLARHYIQGMLTDLDMNHVAQRTIQSSTFISHPLEITMPAMLELIEGLVDDSGLEREKILGIGISAPGPLDARRGILIAPPNFPGWPSTPVRTIVEQETGLPTYIDNDANAAALAEKWLGSARELDNFVFILADEGVGGGLVIDGDIYRGDHDVAGEIGHMTINFSGPVCDCGNTGCMELYCEPRVALDYVRDKLLKSPQGLLGEYAAVLDRLEFEHIAEAALRNDSLAIEAVDHIIQPLAVGIVNVINALDPQAVVIGGKLSRLGGLLIDRLEAKVSERSMSHGLTPVKLQISNLGNEAPVIGAFALVLRELFQNPEFHTINQQVRAR